MNSNQTWNLKRRWPDLRVGLIAALSSIDRWTSLTEVPGTRLMYKGMQMLVTRIALISDLMNAQVQISTPEFVFARQRLVPGTRRIRKEIKR